MSRRLTISLWALAWLIYGFAPPLPAADSAPADPIAHAIERSLTYLDEEGMAWMSERKCAACHHLPMMIWTFNEAKACGYRVNEKSLAEVISWTIEADNRSKIMNPPMVVPDAPVAKGLAIGAPYLSLALQAAAQVDPPTEAGIQRLSAHLLEKQEADGSWIPPSGRPPLLGEKNATTWLTLAAMNVRSTDPTVQTSIDTCRKQASVWLVTAKPDGGNQEAAYRLLAAVRTASLPEETQRLRNEVASRQREDGGWSQTLELPSDAYATGQSLYTLSLAGLAQKDPAVQRAVQFLLKTQTDAGFWQIQSRPITPDGKPGTDLEPISYAGTAWAALGLIRSNPK